jgi:regulator of protease activity HflC (stomatin/prohibitin superfamily)
VIRERVHDAVYKLTDPKKQIRSYVYDIVRGTLPRMELDAAFEAKDDIAHAIRDSLKMVRPLDWRGRMGGGDAETGPHGCIR